MAKVDAVPNLKSGIAYSLGQKYIAFGLALLGSVILARLLTPRETGIFGLAAAAVALFNLLREFGVSDYIVTHRNLGKPELRAAFTVNLLFGWLLAIALWFAAYPMAAFYRETGVADVLHIMSLNFVLLPFGTTASALLHRDLKFRRLFFLQSTAAIVGSVTTIFFAWHGYSFLSPAIGLVAANAVTVLFLLVAEPGTTCYWPTRAGLGAVLHFGGTVSAAKFLEVGAARSSEFIVSGTLGFAANGLLGKAAGVIGNFYEFFIAAIIRVAMPAFVRIDRESGDVKAAYIHATGLMVLFLWVCFALTGVYAYEIVFILFGKNWLACVPLVRILSVSAMITAPFMLASPLLTARRAVVSQLHVQGWSAPITVLAIAIGSLHSVAMVAALTALASLFRVLLLDRALRKVCAIGIEDVLAKLGRTALITGVCVGVAVAARMFLLHQAAPVWVTLPVGALLAVLAACVAAVRLQHPAAVELGRVLRQAIDSRRAAL